MTPSQPKSYILLCYITCYLVCTIHSEGYDNGRDPHHREPISLDDFPNPLEKSGEVACGRGRKSFICDPHQFLASDTADAVDEIIFNATESHLVWCPTVVHNQQFVSNPKEKTRDHYNGLQIGIAIISSFKHHPHTRLRRSDDIGKKAQIYAKSIHDQWGVGEAGCNNAVLIFINIYDRYLYVSTGSGIKSVISDAFVTDFIIPKHVKPLMRQSKYGEAVRFLVESLIDVLQNSDDLEQNALYQSYIEYTTPATFLGIAYDTWPMIILFLGAVGFVGYKFHSERDYRECKRQLARLHAQKQAKKFASASCPICLEEFAANGSTEERENERQTAILICGHKFCKDCLDSWFASQSVSNQKCPICRHDRDDWSAVDGGERKENGEDAAAADDEKTRREDAEDGAYEDEEDERDYAATHGKTSTSDTFYEYENTEQKQEQSTNVNGFGFRRRNRSRYRRGMNMNDWMFQQELMFRMRRIRYMYPNYVSDDMVNRWSRPGYSGGYCNDQSFVRANPNYRPPRTSRPGSSWGSSRRGSGFSFGGGSSSGGGGGGGGW